MLIPYLKFFIRNLRRQGIYAIINIFGLALGLATFVFISLWVIHEFSYERMYKKAENIHQVYKSFLIGNELDVNSSLPYPLGQSLTEGVSEILNMTRVHRDAALISYGDLNINESDIACVDTSYFSIFDHEFVRGTPRDALAKPFNVVITEDIASKYFGNENPLGKVLTFDRDDQYVVSAVIKNIPDNTYLGYNILTPIETAMQDDPDRDNWYSHFIHTYIELSPGIDKNKLHQKLTAHIRKYMDEDATIQLITQPITQKHLYDLTDNNHRIQYVRIFLIIGFLILLIACINYMNLSSAISVKRSREISLRKVVGANRRLLIFQIFGESLLQAFFAMVFGLFIVEVLRPYFNDLSGKSIVIPYDQPWFIIMIILLVMVTAFFSGSYPALLLSSYKPADVFRGKILAGKGALFFRKALVILQFSIATGLIICSLLIYSQLKFVVNKDIGFNKENLMSLPMSGNLGEKYEPFRNELIAHPGVLNVCRSSQLPSHIWNIMRGITWEGNESSETHSFGFAAIDYNYIPTVGLELVKGRNFSKEFGTDSANYIINETAARQLGFENPIGKKMGSDSLDGQIIGVVKDFNSLPLQYDMEPLLLCIVPDFYWRVLIRISPDKQEETISHIENTWNKFVPGFPFEHTFVEDRIDRSYRGEARIGSLAFTFTVLAILITCIGLFGLAAHIAQQRTKEIGIRKVFGASIPSILVIFVKSFAGWVLLSNLIAWPLAYLFIDSWLENFAYRIEIAWYIFVLSAFIALVIAVLTVAYQAYIAAIRNPVKSLSYE